MAAGKVSTLLSEWLLVALIVVSLFFEFALHRIEHWVHHRHHHLIGVLRVLYRELMVLGLVSFIFILYELIFKPLKDTVLSFEFAHIFIFLLAIFYTIIVLSTMLLSLSLSARWKRMERMDLVEYLQVRDKYSDMRSTVNRRNDTLWHMFWWFPNLVKLLNYTRLHETITFHDIRFQFIYFRNLPDKFRFSSFLRKIKATTFIDLVESHWSLWVIFLSIVLVDILRRFLLDTEQTDPSIKLQAAFLSVLRASKVDGKGDKAQALFDSIFTICVAVTLGVAVQVLAWKSRYVYWRLTKHPRMYYEGVDTEVVMEELQKLTAGQERSQQRKERRRRRRSSKVSNQNRKRKSTEIRDAGSDADDEEENRGNRIQSSVRFSVDTKSDAERNRREKESRSPSASATPSKPTVGEDEHLQSFHPRAVSIDVSDRTLPSLSGVTGSMPKPDAVPDNETLIQMGFRHSLDRPRMPQNRAATDLTASSNNGKESSSGRGMVRYSLDVPRPAKLGSSSAQQVKNRPRDTPTPNPASIARSAVEAARRRAALVSESDAQGGSKQQRKEQEDEQAKEGPSSFSTKLGMKATRFAPLSLSPRVSRDFNDDPNRLSRRTSLDSIVGGNRAGRLSVELTDVMHRAELAAHLDSKAEEVDRSATDVNSNADQSGQQSSNSNPDEIKVSMESFSTTQQDQDEITPIRDGLPTLSADDDCSLQSRKTVINATILKNFEAQQTARQRTPKKYPKIVTRLVPRLSRVASPVEKLFWFGSHKFFLWCVEFVLFFSTILLSASAARISLSAVTKDVIEPIQTVSLVLAGLNLVFVLLRIAVIIKRYIFILHNAGLIPEVVALQTIMAVQSNRQGSLDEFEVEGAAASSYMESETEVEDEETSGERQIRLGRFFRSQAESGNIPGIDADSIQFHA